MEAAAIITLISLGHWIEARVSDKASGALKSLLNLAPQTARKIIAAGSSRRKEAPSQFDIRHSSFGTGQSLLTSAATEEIEVPVSELRIGDRVALRPGDRVPVDGVVVEGESAMDEAMLTGESVPVDKKSGSELFAGTVNLNGRLVMRVTATGEETALAHIIAAVQRAQTSRADIQRLGDRVSSVFVPVVVAIAIAAGLWWGLAPESASHVHDWLAQFLWHVACAGRRGGGIHHRRGGFDYCLSVRDGSGDAGGDHGRRQCRRPARNLDPRRRGAGKSRQNHGGHFRQDRHADDGQAGGGGSGVPDRSGKSRSSRASSADDPRAGGRLARNSTHPISQAIAKISTEKIELADWQEIRGAAWRQSSKVFLPRPAQAGRGPR